MNAHQALRARIGYCLRNNSIELLGSFFWKGGGNELGCRVLFRESLSVGVRFMKHHSLSVMVDHISNAGLCDHNDGLDTLGVRYGYRF
jgi:hypothetical protein